MKNRLIALSILTLIANSYSFGFSLKSVSAYFSSEKFEEVKQQEIPLGSIKQLVLNNKRGPIKIQTWQQPNVLLKATRKAAKQEMLKDIAVQVAPVKNKLTIATAINNDIKGSVDYQLLIPATIDLEVSNELGDVSIEQTAGATTVKTETGNVKLSSVQGPIDVDITEHGSVVVEQPGGTVKINSVAGNIDIHDAKANLFAETENGKVTASYKQIPKGTKIQLEASGPIALQLPSETDADIQAEVTKGCVLCDHYITINPFITQLNRKSWDQFKRSVSGMLGKGGSSINLHSASGPIKITKGE